MVTPPAIAKGFSVPKLITLSINPLASTSDAEEPADCCSASSYVKAWAKPVPRTEDNSTKPPCTLFAKHSRKFCWVVLLEAEVASLGKEAVESDWIFLGSDLLSQRTDKGIKPAGLRASMA